ncbi:hypothetical protein DNK59_03450 [Pseudomonas sp. TKO26]|uniref:Uncharacterized protein n=1 Tax=Pseudomonas saponiphila TaxID=556534 RepID=A0A1H4WR45_9PSED|nr:MULTISPECIES: hypothetical protein [Pseudomonas]PYY90412.1 hypothetical protein DNK62_03450 [Pseudomonas sp. TKO30]PYY93284.1 hypothetical protein DNK61_03450 [Pseudomonas sp. TKO29]PYY95512.1 hypothetical protein DNK59_03450 [Pseudomonas sp. TKO26]PYZ01444.1 hypothetical protein DNK60_03450 [Pseudomonas sp. TKO14]SEC95208.1 hypothetical protein SAMN05216178_5530 [Pseudomonas saponiphila]
MLILRSLIIALSLLASAAHALETTGLPPATLKAYAATLSSVAGSSQWQQLWKRSRDQGAFNAQGEQPRFTVSQDKLPDMARSTLSNATSVTAQNTTQALYRYEFSTAIGQARGKSLNAICLLVDWRSLPSGTRPEDTSHMGNASLLQTYPCP